MPDKDSVFAELFEAHHKAMGNFCITQGVRPENVDDIVSEAFTRALAKKETFLSLTDKQQKAWLYSAVVFIIKEHRNKKSPVPFSEIENIENFFGSEDNIDRAYREENFKYYVKQVYAELESDKERELFKLILDKKIDYKTLTETFGVSSGAARVMVSRLRKKLRKIVNKILYD